MWTITATIAGAVIGLGLMRNLAALHYRRPEETDLPEPAQAWWLIPTLAASWGTLTWQHTDDAWPILVLWLPLTIALGWLSAVDFDAQRLPDKVLLPNAGWTILILATAAIVSQDAIPALIAVGIGLTAGIGTWILHLASHGAIGFGDVKLVALLCMSLAFINPTLVLPALVTGCLTTIIVSLTTHQPQLSFGPWLALGFTIAVLFE